MREREWSVKKKEKGERKKDGRRDRGERKMSHIRVNAFCKSLSLSLFRARLLQIYSSSSSREKGLKMCALSLQGCHVHMSKKLSRPQNSLTWQYFVFVLGFSSFYILPLLPRKTIHALKVVKSDVKINILSFHSKTLKSMKDA
jgi:hypothetical protein